MTGVPAAVREVVQRLRRLVEHESPSGDARALTALARYVAAELGSVGADVARYPAPELGVNLVAKLPGRRPDAAPLLVLGHLDTVHPTGTLAKRPLRIEDGRLHGPGTYDMKSGLAVLLEALARLKRDGDRPERPLRIVLNCDEEIGSVSSRQLIESAAEDAEAVLVLEPPIPGGAAKTARKGVAIYQLEIHGREAHAGTSPAEGVSAVVELAHQILALDAMTDLERGVNVNVAPIRGGTVSNVTAGHAWAEVDVRFTTLEDGRRLDARVCSLEPRLEGTRLLVTGGVRRPPLERTPGVVALFERARAAAAEIGFELSEGSTGGASDGCFTAAMGIPTLDGLGVDGGGAHAEHEHVLLADLAPRVALIEKLLRTL